MIATLLAAFLILFILLILLEIDIISGFFTHFDNIVW